MKAYSKPEVSSAVRMFKAIEHTANDKGLGFLFESSTDTFWETPRAYEADE